MAAEQTPTGTNDAQALHAMVDGLKSLLDCSVLDNGAVLVGLLPQHRCCSGSCCHGVEPRDNKEIREKKRDPRI